SASPGSPARTIWTPARRVSACARCGATVPCRSWPALASTMPPAPPRWPARPTASWSAVRWSPRWPVQRASTRPSSGRPRSCARCARPWTAEPPPCVGAAIAAMPLAKCYRRYSGSYRVAGLSRAYTSRVDLEKPERMSWLKKLTTPRIRTDSGAGRKRSVPEGLWEKCDKCGAVLYRPELEENLEVCPKCSHHMPIRARVRLLALFDPDSTTEIGAGLGPTDVLKFKDQKKYSDRIKAAQKSSGERDALIAMEGKLANRDLVAAAFDFAFMGGSMGSVVGERFALAAERALELRCPLVAFSATGGARMQESLFSLMQMAKTSAALGRLRAA